mmetsp:Transcript_4464/g.19035  ORF Transcript_4464/g.19035 Transcript_4464/m.19035 type:complete len:251 (+) Transcript_4464:614-1366(+)
MTAFSSVQALHLRRLEELGQMRVGHLHALEIHRASLFLFLLRVRRVFVVVVAGARGVRASRRGLDAYLTQGLVPFGVVRGDGHAVERGGDVLVHVNLVCLIHRIQHAFARFRVDQENDVAALDERGGVLHRALVRVHDVFLQDAVWVFVYQRQHLAAVGKAVLGFVREAPRFFIKQHLVVVQEHLPELGHVHRPSQLVVKLRGGHGLPGSVQQVHDAFLFHQPVGRREVLRGGGCQRRRRALAFFTFLRL